MKFLMCVGAEKAGTTWLYEYFKNHPAYNDIGKELNLIQRDDLVPDFAGHKEFRSDIYKFFPYVASITTTSTITGDFTHYEGSTENIFRLYKDEFAKHGIEVVPVYIMRDPIHRAWSSWNMLGKDYKYNIPESVRFIADNFFSCKYKETIEALDNVFDKPLYFFYEDFFKQENIIKICNAVGLSSMKADCEKVINPGNYKKKPDKKFIELFGRTPKNIAAVKYIHERFKDVPWNIEDYTKV